MINNLKYFLNIKSDLSLVLIILVLGVILPIIMFQTIWFEIYKKQELRDNLNKKVVVTTTQKNENNIALILKNPLNTDIKNIGLTCQTTVLSGDVIKTYASIFDKISANRTKTITVTQLTYGHYNTPVDIRQVSAIQCNVSEMTT